MDKILHGTNGVFLEHIDGCFHFLVAYDLTEEYWQLVFCNVAKELNELDLAAKIIEDSIISKMKRSKELRKIIKERKNGKEYSIDKEKQGQAKVCF